MKKHRSHSPLIQPLLVRLSLRLDSTGCPALAMCHRCEQPGRASTLFGMLVRSWYKACVMFRKSLPHGWPYQLIVIANLTWPSSTPPLCPRSRWSLQSPIHNNRGPLIRWPGSCQIRAVRVTWRWRYGDMDNAISVLDQLPSWCEISGFGDKPGNSSHKPSALPKLRASDARVDFLRQARTEQTLGHGQEVWRWRRQKREPTTRMPCSAAPQYL